MNSRNALQELRKLYGEIETNVRSLKNFNIMSDLYGPILISIVMSKLPDDIKLVISRSMTFAGNANNRHQWKILDLMNAFRQESREMCGFVSASAN